MKKIKISTILGLAALVLALVALLMPLTTAFSMKTEVTILGKTTTTLIAYGSVYAFMFGGSAPVTTTITSPAGTNVNQSTLELERIAFTPLIGWILLALGLLAFCGAIFLACKKNKLTGLVMIGAAVLLVVGAVLFFASRDSLLLAANGKDATMEDVNNALNATKTAVSLGFGVVGTGIFAILSGLSAAGSAVLAQLKK